MRRAELAAVVLLAEAVEELVDQVRMIQHVARPSGAELRRLASILNRAITAKLSLQEIEPDDMGEED